MLVFLGGAGAGLSALVNIFNELDFKNIVVVDKYQSEISDKLEQKGIKVVIGDGVYDFSPEDIIIYSDAVVNSQDFQKIKNNRKFTYFDFVGEISKRFQTISIAGTHGKTSTTSMLISSLVKSNFENFGLGIVGGFVPDLDNKNYFLNNNKKQEIKTIFEKILTPKGSRPTQYFKELYFVIEADEFNRHFLLLDTYIAGITKVDHDHKDIYPTEKDYLEAFKIFINKTRKKVFTNDDNFAKKLNIDFIETNKEIEFDYIFGDHMKKNASLVLEIMKELGINENKALESIKSFKGVWRRQEYLGDLEIKGDLGDWEIKGDLGENKNLNYRNDKISYEIIGLAMKIHNEFGGGLQEKLYQKALKNMLIGKGFKVEEEKNIKISLDGIELTYGKIDLLVNNSIALEIKSSKKLIPDFYKQLKKYIKFGGYDYGLILNFGKESLEFRRVEQEIPKIPQNPQIPKIPKNPQISKIPQNPQIPIYTDYAHHPVEIQAVYKAFRENFPNKKLIGVFQPHQLFRFVSYEKDFLKSLKKFDEIFIYDIYSVREDELIKKLIKEKNLQVKNNQQAIEKIGQEIASKLNGKYIKNFNELLENLKNKSGIVILMTAGDLDYKMRNYLKKARN